MVDGRAGMLEELRARRAPRARRTGTPQRRLHQLEAACWSQTGRAAGPDEAPVTACPPRAPPPRPRARGFWLGAALTSRPPFGGASPGSCRCFFSARALGAKLAAVPKCGCGGAVVDVGGHRRPCVRPPRWRCWIYRRRARRVPRRGRLGRGRAPVAWRVWAAPSATVFGARDALEEYMAARACMASIYIAR